MKYFIGTFLLVIFIFPGLSNQIHAQTWNVKGLTGLKEGQKMPDVFLSNIIRYKKTNAKLLTEFGNKPIIIDFWNTHCTSCVRVMPCLDSIQNEFKGKITILLSNKYDKLDDPQKIAMFFEKNKYARKNSLPCSIQDSVLGTLFPGTPFRVWIDKDGIIQHITEKEIDRNDVLVFLKGEQLHLPAYQYEVEPGRTYGNSPLMMIDLNFNQGKGRLFYSYFGGYDSISSKAYSRAPYLENGYINYMAKNNDLYQLYLAAYYYTDKIKPYQFIFHSPDSLKYVINNKDYILTGDESRNQIYSYEISAKVSSLYEGYKLIQTDLDRFFKISSSLEKRDLPCYVIKSISAKPMKRFNKNNYSQKFSTSENVMFLACKWEEIIHELNISPSQNVLGSSSDYLPYQIIDETGFDKNLIVNITFPAFTKWSNLLALNKALAKYNILISVENRQLDAIVLR
jgi:thiol-disulfide isomerase/thioredoxin